MTGHSTLLDFFSSAAPKMSGTRIRANKIYDFISNNGKGFWHLMACWRVNAQIKINSHNQSKLVIFSKSSQSSTGATRSMAAPCWGSCSRACSPGWSSSNSTFGPALPWRETRSWWLLANWEAFACIELIFFYRSYHWADCSSGTTEWTLCHF